MKKLLSILAIATLTGSVVVSSVAPVSNTLNSTTEEPSIVTETRDSINSYFDDLISSNTLSTVALYSTENPTREISSEEALNLARDKANELLTNFAETGLNSEEDLIKYVAEQIPEFKTNSEELHKEENSLNGNQQNKAVGDYYSLLSNDYSNSRMTATIKVNSFIPKHASEYLRAVYGASANWKLANIASAHVSAYSAVASAGFYAIGWLIPTLIPFGVTTNLLSIGTAAFAFYCEDRYEEYEHAYHELSNEDVWDASNFGLDVSSALIGLAEKEGAFADFLWAFGAIRSVLNLIKTLCDDLKEMQKYQEWESLNYGDDYSYNLSKDFLIKLQ